MKPIIVLLAVMFCVVVVTGRNLNDFKSEDEDSDIQLEKHVRDQTNSQMRHRRRSRQSYNNRYPVFDNYNYNNYESYDRRYDHRRDYYDRQEEEMLSRILKQIEEIAFYLKLNQSPAPPPPPQIINIPYPYPVPQCQDQTKVPEIPPRDTFPNNKDKNQIWGLVPDGKCRCVNDNSDGSRPINLDPIISNEPTVKPPPVDHGTSQAGMTTARPSFSEPGRCKAAILVCCQETSPQEKQKCFAQYGCNKTYSIATACNPKTVQHVIEEFADAYAPINRT